MSGRPIIAAVGAGRMGRGIAHAFAYGGHEVRLIDAKPRPAADFEALRKDALAEVEGSLRMMARLGQFGDNDVPRLLARVSVHSADKLGPALEGVHFIFEGVPETREAKAEAFARIDAVAEPDAILASTTSTFLSSLLAGLTRRPGRFLNAHWLNPAFLVPLVEVSPHEGTDPDALAAVMALLEGIGKKPVQCRASPGYIVPRIQALAMNEAARLVEEGVATAEDVDTAVLYGFGFRFAVLGLIEFIDWGGGDILHYASAYLAEAMEDERFRAPAIVGENMRAGRIGMKTGAGFYDWAARDVDAHRRERLGGFLAMLRQIGAVRPPVLD